MQTEHRSEQLQYIYRINCSEVASKLSCHLRLKSMWRLYTNRSPSSWTKHPNCMILVIFPLYMSPTEGSSGGGRSTCLSCQRSESLSLSWSFLGLGERSDLRTDLSLLFPRSPSLSLSRWRSWSLECDLDLERCRLFLSRSRSLSWSRSLSLCLSRSLLLLRLRLWRLLFSDLQNKVWNVKKKVEITSHYNMSLKSWNHTMNVIV